MRCLLRFLTSFIYWNQCNIILYPTFNTLSYGIPALTFDLSTEEYALLNIVWLNRKLPYNVRRTAPKACAMFSFPILRREDYENMDYDDGRACQTADQHMAGSCDVPQNDRRKDRKTLLFNCSHWLSIMPA